MKDELSALVYSLLEAWWTKTPLKDNEIKWDEDDIFWIQVGNQWQIENDTAWVDVGTTYSDRTIDSSDLAQIMFAAFCAIKKRDLHFDLQSCDKYGEYKRYARVYSGPNRILGPILSVKGGEYSHQEESIALLGAYVDWLKKNLGEVV